MTFEAYTNPDFGFPQKLIFFTAALAGILICIFLITLLAKISSSAAEGDKKEAFHERSHNRIQLFFEMIISGTSVMSFSCAYVIINHIYSLIQSGEGGSFAASLAEVWDNGRDFVLLLLICLSCVLNTILDRLIIPLKKIDKEEKASIRLLAMFYVIIILVCLNNIGDESEYNPVMMYYLGLMVGRFVYFDASAADFLQAIKNAFKNISLLIMGLLITLILCRFGFAAGYLLERNYYIVGIFYTHLFMLAAIFLIHHSHILHLLIRKPKSAASKTSSVEKNNYKEDNMSCETCVYYEYDENDDTYYCTSDMDEDDYARLYSNNFRGCPYYQSNDEYSVVKHQM